MTRDPAASGLDLSKDVPRARSWFDRFSHWAAHAAGRPSGLLAAVGLVLLWLASGPVFGFSDTWQLVINTGTTVVTFLMVFLIQGTQNRDTAALHVKLDELIRCTRGAHNALLDLEELSEEDLERIRANYEELARRARIALRRGDSDVDTPEVEDTK